MFEATVSGWVVTLAVIGGLIAFDLWYSGRSPGMTGMRQAAGWSVFYIAIAVLFGVVFALDSIPAVFGVTSHAYIVFAANAFALLGLRALFFLVSGLLDRLIYLSTGLALILAFIGGKLVLHFAHLHDHAIPEISTGVSLGVIGAILAVTTVASVIKSHRDPTARAHAGSLRSPPPKDSQERPVGARAGRVGAEQAGTSGSR